MGGPEEFPAVLYEDNHLLAVAKRAGDIAQGDRTGDEPLGERMKRFIKRRDDKPGRVFLGVVHRLDRPVSGVLLFAKTSKALERLNRTFRERRADKRYWAIVARRPDPPEGRLEDDLLKDGRRNKSRVVRKPGQDSRRAVTDYRLLASGERYHLLEVRPRTGRHHQIRVQLARIGCPIRGDLKYGAPRSNPDGSISLHARRLELEHPVRHEPLVLVAPFPGSDPLWAALAGSVAAD